MLTKSLSRILLVGLLVSGFCFSWNTLQAQSTEDLQPVTRVLAFTGVNVISAPGKMSQKTNVVIRNGLIEAVGNDIIIPADAQVVTADSMFMYAGFIEAVSHTGVPKPKSEERSGNTQDRGQQRPSGINPANPPYERAGIQPDRSVKDLLEADDKSVEEMRELGFTAAHVVPHGNMLPGSGAVILLSGDNADQMVLKDNSSQFAQFDGASRVYPATVIAVMAKYRELYRQAEHAKNHEDAYAANPGGMQRPNYDRVLRAFFPVIDKKQAVFFHAESSLDAHRAITLKKDLGFPLVIVEAKTAQDYIPAIQKHNLGICLTLDLPKDKSEKDFEIKEGLTGTALELAKEQQAMYKRQAEAIQKYEGQAAALARAGIPISFSTLELKSKDFSANLQRMHKAGLSADNALAALTTNPAKMLGVDAMLGTIEKGKIANMVVMNKQLLEDKAQVRYVVVDGKLHEYEIKEKKKGKGGEGGAVNAVGTWSYVANIPGRETEGELIITGEPGNYAGTISSSQGGGALDIENVEVDGSTLSFSYSVDMGGQSLAISIEVELDGDTFEGELTAGNFGSYPMEGERTGKPD
jgi:imidazolonepropionase-like amidohydrolase